MYSEKRKIIDKTYREKYPQKIKQKWKKWYKKNKEKKDEYNIKWRQENIEKCRVLSREWRIKNKEKARFKDKINEYRRRNCIGFHTLKNWEDLKEKYNYCCADCGMQEPFIDQWYPKLTEDHIIPITKGGSNNIENIQPLCHRCNSKKSNKMINNNGGKVSATNFSSASSK